MSLWNDFDDPIFDGVDWRVLRARPSASLFPKLIAPLLSSNVSLSLLFLYRLILWGTGLRADKVSGTNNNDNNNNNNNNNNNTRYLR